MHIFQCVGYVGSVLKPKNAYKCDKRCNILFFCKQRKQCIYFMINYILNSQNLFETS